MESNQDDLLAELARNVGAEAAAAAAAAAAAVAATDILQKKSGNHQDTHKLISNEIRDHDNTRDRKPDARKHQPSSPRHATISAIIPEHLVGSTETVAGTTIANSDVSNSSISSSSTKETQNSKSQPPPTKSINTPISTISEDRGSRRLTVLESLLNNSVVWRMSDSVASPSAPQLSMSLMSQPGPPTAAATVEHGGSKEAGAGGAATGKRRGVTSMATECVPKRSRRYAKLKYSIED